MDLATRGFLFSDVTLVVYCVVTAVSIITAIVSFRSGKKGLLSLRQSIKIGTTISLVSGIFYVVFNFFIYEFVIGSTDFLKRLGENNPHMSSETIQDFRKFAVITGPPVFLILSCLYGLFIGWITGLFSKIEHKKSSLTKNKIVSLGIAAAMVLSIFLPFFKIGKLNLFLLDILQAGESPESILLLILIIAFGVLTFMDKHLFARICSVIILIVLLYGAYNMADAQSRLSQLDVDINIFKLLGLGAYLLLISSVLGVVFLKPEEK